MAALLTVAFFVAGCNDSGDDSPTTPPEVQPEETTTEETTTEETTPEEVTTEVVTEETTQEIEQLPDTSGVVQEVAPSIPPELEQPNNCHTRGSGCEDIEARYYESVIPGYKTPKSPPGTQSTNPEAPYYRPASGPCYGMCTNERGENNAEIQMRHLKERGLA